MKTKIIKLFTFNELSEAQKLQVLDKHRNINVEFEEWFEPCIDYWQNILLNNGFLNCEINFSGFWSQGSGASFTCKSINLDDILESFNLKKLINNRFINLLDFGLIDFEFSLTRYNSMYYHEKTTSLQFYFKTDHLGTNINRYLDNLSDQIQTILSNEILSINKQIYQDLKNDYYHLTSDKNIIETFQSNDYHFNSETLEIEY